VSADPVAAAALRLREATETGRPCAPVRDLIGAGDVGTAYEVQQLNLDLRVAAGHPRIGRKIGLTSPAVQRQLGVDSPDFGGLLADMRVPVGGEVPGDVLLQPKVEAEVAFWLGEDLDGHVDDRAALRGAVAGVAAAIEIVDSRIAGWDITLVDTVADNASSGLFVVSDDVVPLSGVEPADLTMQLRSGEELVSSGDGRACLGDPLNALAWLARACLDLGDPLRAGEVVLSGALGPMSTVTRGATYSARITCLADVAVSFLPGVPRG
jgi:2-keto-4-pentenoate hydratase